MIDCDKIQKKIHGDKPVYEAPELIVLDCDNTRSSPGTDDAETDFLGMPS